MEDDDDNKPIHSSTLKGVGSISTFRSQAAILAFPGEQYAY